MILNLYNNAKSFEHKIIPFEPLQDEITDQGRVYILPDQSRVFSVTTRLGKALSKEHLIKWRERIGNAEADKITNMAAARGTAVHALCENYLLNKPEYPDNSMPVNIHLFKTIKPILDKHISTVYAIEAPLYSTSLKTAGRVDLIAKWDTKPAIIDFKTSNRTKTKENILSYFLQTTCYAMMFEELTGVKLDTVVIIIAVEDDHPQVFIEKTINYRQKVLEIFQREP